MERLHVVVGRNGEGEQIYLLGGDPLLTRAAIEAAKPWRYELQPEYDAEVKFDINVNVASRK